MVGRKACQRRVEPLTAAVPDLNLGTFSFAVDIPDEDHAGKTFLWITRYRRKTNQGEVQEVASFIAYSSNDENSCSTSLLSLVTARRLSTASRNPIQGWSRV